MRASYWIFCLLIGACADEPNVPVPSPAPKAQNVTEVAPVTPEKKPIGALTAWKGGGALVENELMPGSEALAVQLAQQYVAATAKNLKPYVMVYSDECAPCVSLRKSLTDPVMREAFQGVYLILLSQARWGIHMDEVGMASGSFPRIHELTDNGQASPRLITGAAWEEDIPANMGPPLQAFLRQ